MPGPGPRIPEEGRQPAPPEELAFPPVGRPDPGPLARPERRPAPRLPDLPLPPPVQERPAPRRRSAPEAAAVGSPRRPAPSTNRGLALLVLLLALVGAGLAMAQEPRAWRLGGLPWAATRAPQATRHPGPPPSAVPVEALSALARAQVDAPLAWNQRLRQLTFEPCCAGAWWAADSASLYFIDRPEGQVEATLYRQPIWPPGALPEAADAALLPGGPGQEDQPRFAARPEGEVSIVQDLSSGSEWQLPTGGNPTLVAPDGSHAAWYTGNGGRAEVDGFNRFTIARIDGSEQRELGGLWGGSLVRFLADSRHLLALGRPVADQARYVLQRIDVSTGEVATVAEGMWLSEVALSPGGLWVAYLVSLDRAAPGANGVWVAPTEPGLAAPRKLELHGAYRWRDDQRLLYVPQLPGAAGHALLEFDVRQGASRVLVDPEHLALRIADNDWSVSPDGKRLAFRSEDDRTLWLLDLPE